MNRVKELKRLDRSTISGAESLQGNEWRNYFGSEQFSKAMERLKRYQDSHLNEIHADAHAAGFEKTDDWVFIYKDLTISISYNPPTDVALLAVILRNDNTIDRHFGEFYGNTWCELANQLNVCVESSKDKKEISK